MALSMLDFIFPEKQPVRQMGQPMVPLLYMRGDFPSDEGELGRLAFPPAGAAFLPTSVFWPDLPQPNPGTSFTK